MSGGTFGEESFPLPSCWRPKWTVKQPGKNRKKKKHDDKSRSRDKAGAVILKKVCRGISLPPFGADSNGTTPSFVSAEGKKCLSVLPRAANSLGLGLGAGDSADLVPTLQLKLSQSPASFGNVCVHVCALRFGSP
jgi:hypothetical protein